MPYMITNGKDYVTFDNNNRPTLTRNKKAAYIWEKSQAAANMTRSLPRGLQDKHLGIVCAILPTDKPAIGVRTGIPPEVDPSIIKEIKTLYSFSCDIEERKRVLTEEQTKVEMELMDIEHAAEFYALNACEGFKLYKLLREARIKRRKIKDELLIIDHILESKITSTDIQHLQNQVAGLDDRQYTPRVRPELFERGK